MSPLWWFCCTFALLANLDVFEASQCPGWYDSSAGYPGYPPYPIVVKSKEKNSWKHILPIILLMMTDGGFGNSSPGYVNPGPCCCNGCCCCSNDQPFPVPFPIPIGINSPIIC